MTALDRNMLKRLAQEAAAMQDWELLEDVLKRMEKHEAAEKAYARWVDENREEGDHE